jgi:hypothetical protein
MSNELVAQNNSVFGKNDLNNSRLNLKQTQNNESKINDKMLNSS